ncbi:hypothetical protein Emed_000079 [Eimeria media]
MPFADFVAIQEEACFLAGNNILFFAVSFKEPCVGPPSRGPSRSGSRKIKPKGSASGNSSSSSTSSSNSSSSNSSSNSSSSNNSGSSTSGSSSSSSSNSRFVLLENGRSCSARGEASHLWGLAAAWRRVSLFSPSGRRTKLQTLPASRAF